MKNSQPLQLAGLCIDHTQAVLITTKSPDNSFDITERIEGPSSFTSESEHTRNNAKQSDLLKYHKTVADKLNTYDTIMIFGYGKAQEELNNHLKQDARFKNKTITVEATDKINDHQKVAFVKKYFQKLSSGEAVESN